MADTGENILISLRDLAKELCVTPAKATYWVSLLNIVLIMQKRAGFMTVDQAQLLREMASQVAGGKSPQVAAFHLTGETKAEIIHQEQPRAEPSFRQLTDKISSIEDGLKMAFEVLIQDNRTLRQEMAKMAEEQSAIMARLMPPVEPARKVIPWSPPPTKDPLEGLGVWKKIWTQFVQPEKMRRYDS
ncbi:MAG: hypothetical protein WA705_09320 [Candidatus Ozemobacteraceae bacterium]